MGVFRFIQLSVAAVLAGFTVFHSMKSVDAWIYTWLTGAAAVLLLLNRPRCPYWRFSTAVIIVLGALETVFLAWSLHTVESGPLIAHSHALPEGRNILLTALATTVTISSRLHSAHHDSMISYVRTLILFVALIGLIPIVGYSACFYSKTLPFCHVFHSFVF
uniref:Uncharacterized protein n=1 Tax=Panagrolaimus sp. ES5 TaxID=591445 RepID=A0AC34FE94_9BILA